LFVDVASLEQLHALAAADWFRSAPPGLRQGISFAVDGSNCRELPELLVFCAEQGVLDLLFPIFRAGRGDLPSYPGAPARAKLARALQGTERPADLRLTIHDPFLWKAFYPERPFPGGGCQAANTMLYLAPDGGVYPCPALPYRLGTLGETTLTAITASAARTQLRQTLTAPPAECLACAALPQCTGGCRGRAYLAHASWEEADPACR
jgi:GeoRSP system SPASM domain protein